MILITLTRVHYVSRCTKTALTRPSSALKGDICEQQWVSFYIYILKIAFHSISE